MPGAAQVRGRAGGHQKDRSRKPRRLAIPPHLVADPVPAHLVRKGFIEDIFHAGLRALLREEGFSLQAIKTWKESNDPDFNA